jgi:hypothetical protein
MHKQLKKLSKYERASLRQEKLKAAMAGSGRYLFKNNTSGELELPKMPLEGTKRKVGKNEEFIGDSYFLQMLKTNDLKLIRIIEDKDLPMDKLITEQPPVVTQDGKVEFVINDPKKKKINEETDAEKQKNVLLTEDPMGGIVIVD